MRALPAGLAASLATGVATLCRCWLLTRRDGHALGFTDHDRDLIITGQIFEARSGFEASAIEREAGLNTQGGELHGLLSSERIRAADIEAGLYDGARIDAYLVNWQAPALDFRLDAASLGEIRRQDERFIAETRDAFAAWDMPRGRLYTSACAADFGDAACGLDARSPAFCDELTITALPEPRRIAGAGNRARETGFYVLGRAQFLSGPNAGFSTRIEAEDSSGLLLALAPPRAPSIGDRVRIVAGCDKRFATCRGRFANAVNFRGFPYVPAPEAVFSYAVQGEGRHKGRPLVW